MAEQSSPVSTTVTTPVQSSPAASSPSSLPEATTTSATATTQPSSLPAALSLSTSTHADVEMRPSGGSRDANASSSEDEVELARQHSGGSSVGDSEMSDPSSGAAGSVREGEKSRGHRQRRPAIWHCPEPKCPQTYKKNSGRSIRRHLCECYLKHHSGCEHLSVSELIEYIASQQEAGLYHTGLCSFRKRTNRRHADDLPTHERWTCNKCSKKYRSTSTRSIRHHEDNCTGVWAGSSASDTSANEARTFMRVRADRQSQSPVSATSMLQPDRSPVLQRLTSADAATPPPLPVQPSQPVAHMSMTAPASAFAPVPVHPIPLRPAHVILTSPQMKQGNSAEVSMQTAFFQQYNANTRTSHSPPLKVEHVTQTLPAISLSASSSTTATAAASSLTSLPALISPFVGNLPSLHPPLTQFPASQQVITQHQSPLYMFLTQQPQPPSQQQTLMAPTVLMAQPNLPWQLHSQQIPSPPLANTDVSYATSIPTSIPPLALIQQRHQQELQQIQELQQKIQQNNELLFRRQQQQFQQQQQQPPPLLHALSSPLTQQHPLIPQPQQPLMQTPYAMTTPSAAPLQQSPTKPQAPQPRRLSPQNKNN